ncbi:putative lipase 5 [[Candida] railenensis]|uniref:Lipase 5 n=1 Tax=[Candida] railenensis TaxID=45579 RepID=A0A9P0QSC2_9ASCO|nr:putative lipase 5 [[Candida] railenensis]
MRISHLIIGIFLRLVFAAPTINPRAGLVAPSDDPFYTPPTGYEDAELGSILRIRKPESPLAIITLELDLQEVYQILVRSEDTFHQPNAVVATVLVPFNADPGKLVSFHSAEDTASPNCAPSYAMQVDSPASTWITPQAELALIIPLLDEGYFVIVPDYEGPKAAFIAGYQTGHAVLNCIRGALNLGSQIGLNSDAEVVLTGYSGGGFAVAWAAALHPTYAPELSILGGAMGGIPVEPLETAKNTMGTLFAGFIVAAVLGLSHEYPQLAEELPSLLIPDQQEYFYSAQDICLVEILAFFAYATWDQYCIEGDNVLDNPVVQNITSQNSLLENGLLPTIPLFIYSSEMDEINPIESTDKLYDLYCSNGVNVEYRKDVFSEHIVTVVEGSGLAVNFVKDRFNKVELNPTCQNSTVAFDLLNEGGLVGLGDIISGVVDVALGSELGPSSPYSNTTSALSGSPAGSSGIIATVVNFVSNIIQKAITPDDPDNLTKEEFIDILAGYINSIGNGISFASNLISSIFGFGSSDTTSSTASSNSTGTSSGGGLISTLLSTGGSLVSSLLSNSTTDGSTSSSSSGGILSSLLSSATSIISSLFTSK